MNVINLRMTSNSLGFADVGIVITERYVKAGQNLHVHTYVRRFNEAIVSSSKRLMHNT